MRLKVFSLISFSLCLAVATVYSQEDEVFLLSPFSIDEDSSEYLGQNSLAGTRIQAFPPIMLTKKADFFAIQFQIVNDSRLPEEREKEMHQTILKIVKEAPSKGYIIQNRKDIIDASNYQVDVRAFSGKPDTSFIGLLAKVELEDKDEVSELTDEMARFIQSQQMVGRSYVIVQSAGLSIKEPQSYRHELLKIIATDIEQVKDLFSGDIKLQIDGLDNRISVRQASDRNVDLYIPYSFSFINTQDGI